MADAIWNDRYLLSNMTSEKLYAKSPLTTGVSGTSAYIGLEPSATYNETVLFQTSSVDDTKWNVTLSEDIGNFERIKILARRANNSTTVNLDCPNVYEDDTSAISGNKKMITCDCDMNGTEYKYFTVFTLSGNKYTEYSARLMNYGSAPNAWQTTNFWLHPTKIIGINRKEV